jgi:hypothetical protein
MIDASFIFARDLAFVGAIYVLGACLCRLRLSGISPKWIALYTGVFASASWYVFALIYESVNGRDILTICMVCTYIFFTQPSWAKGVPEVARRAAK